MLMHCAAQVIRCLFLVGRLLVFAWALAPVASAQCNTAPTAVADTTETPDNKVLWIDVLANDHDPDGQPLTVSVVSETCPGAVTASSGGLLSYTPTPVSDPGIDCQVTYRIADGSGATDTAVVAVAVKAVPPLIFADGFESGNTSAWSESQ